MKKILLINPPETGQSGYTNPPLGLLYIAGTLVKYGFDVRVIDGCIEGKDAVYQVMVKYQPELVGITCLTPGRKQALQVAKMAKDLNSTIKVVMGGAHPTIMYKQILENYSYVDYIVLGEGEETCLEIAQDKEPSLIKGLAYREKGEIVKTPARRYVEDLDNLPFPAWHLIDLKRYPAIGKGVIKGINLAEETRISLIFSRGCIGHCNFCSSWWIWRRWRRRSAKNMVDEIDLLYRNHGIRHFCFADDTMTVDQQATVELCDKILEQKLNIVFHVTTRSDCLDKEVLQKLKSAGCYQIAIGIETASPKLLKKMRKESEIEASEKAIRLAKEVGLSVQALMIIGNVGETKETIKDTVNFLRRTQPDVMSCVGSLWVFPGTRLYQECKRKGFIDDDFWLTDEPYKIYTLEHSMEELHEFGKRVTFYDSRRKIENFIEIFKKQPASIPKRIVNKIKHVIDRRY